MTSKQTCSSGPTLRFVSSSIYVLVISESGFLPAITKAQRTQNSELILILDSRKLSPLVSIYVTSVNCSMNLKRLWTRLDSHISGIWPANKGPAYVRADIG